MAIRVGVLEILALLRTSGTGFLSYNLICNRYFQTAQVEVVQYPGVALVDKHNF